MNALPLANGNLSSTWIVIALAANLVIGTVVLATGRKLPGKGDWIVGGGLFGLLALLVATWISKGAVAFAPFAWAKGWIWPHDSAGALTVGLFQDPVGFAVCSMACVLGMVLVCQRATLAREERAQRICAASAVGTAGLALAWCSWTAWMALAGFGLAALGGFLTFGARWDIEPDADIASRYGREKSWGFVLALLGTAAIASQGVDLSWAASQGAVLPSDPAAMLGLALMLSGVLLQFQPAPFLGWITRPSQAVPFVRLVLAQLFPAWAAFALLYRMQPQLDGSAVWLTFGWVALGCAALTCFSGVVQEDWRRSVRLWLSGGLLLSCSALVFAGSWPGLSLAVGFGAGACAVAFFGTALEVDGTGAGSHHQKAAWSKSGAIAGWLCASGVFGFVSASGAIRWLASGLAVPGMLVGFGGALLLVAMVGCRALILLWRIRDRSDAPWILILAPIMILTSALGFIWTGALTGGVVPGHPDLLVQSLLESQFVASLDTIDLQSWLIASWIHFALLAIAATLVVVLMRKGRDFGAAMRKRFPRFSRALTTDFGLGRIGWPLVRGMVRAGAVSQEWIDEGLWNRWGPWLVRKVLSSIGTAAFESDTVAIRGLNEGVRRGVEIPSRVLQLIQSGDLQWYLFFAVGSTVAILLHFLRF